MIECIFSIDYEIHGDGRGSVRDIVYEPAERLKYIFARHGAKMVVFFEALEFEQIESARPDDGVFDIRRQTRELHETGHEIALHIHPQWANARWSGERWVLDESEYNLCILPAGRIAEIVDRSIAYIRDVVGDPGYLPLAFRAGGWLFQPSDIAAGILHSRGIRIDSSVFKGALNSRRGTDYRRSLRNPEYWRFNSDVNVPDALGGMLEIPIHSEMVAPWKFLGSKRIDLNQVKAIASDGKVLRRMADFSRFRQPLKFDFTRMGFAEMCRMVNNALRRDERNPQRLWPLVAIGHTKNVESFDVIEAFLGWLQSRGIPTTTYRSVYDRLNANVAPPDETRSTAI